jgi:hypothetical protein
MTENEFRKEFEDSIKANSPFNKIMIGKFKEDYETSNCLQYGNYTGGDFGYTPCLKSEYIYFKKGDVIKAHSYSFRNGTDNTIDIRFDNKAQIQVPMSKIDIIGSENVSKDEWFKINNNVKKRDKPSVKPTTEDKQQNLSIENNTLTTEDKFYEMLGIKKTPSGSIGIQSRPLGRLLVTVVLVAGYFAYKKFKK